MSESMRLSHRAVATSALAVILAGGTLAPAVADADDKGGRGDKGRKDQAEQRKPKRGGERAQRPQGGERQRPQGGDRAQPARQGTGGSAQDPAGNNGTFKVDGPPYDAGMDNEPHVACEFRLLFFGFDDDQTGDITIAGHAPSGSGVVDVRNDVLISDDPAGGGPNDPDAVVQYSLSDLDLSGLTAHDKHGYHLKVTVETGEPGGVKHKVFWLEPCDAAGESAVGAAGAAGETDANAGANVGAVGAIAGVDTETAARAAVLGVSLSREEAARAEAARAAAARAAAARGSGAEVLGVSLSRSLAFTGSFTERLLAAGAALLALGTGLLTIAARKPRGRHAA